MAEKLGYEENPYDALLDLHEEGLRTRDVRGVFSVLEPALNSTGRWQRSWATRRTPTTLS